MDREACLRCSLHNAALAPFAAVSLTTGDGCAEASQCPCEKPARGAFLCSDLFFLLGLSLHLPSHVSHWGARCFIFVGKGKEKRQNCSWFIKKYLECVSFAHHCTIHCAWLHSHSLTETVELLLVISSLWL